jgi:hypothetical protein
MYLTLTQFIEFNKELSDLAKKYGYAYIGAEKEEGYKVSFFPRTSASTKGIARPQPVESNDFPDAA